MHLAKRSSRGAFALQHAEHLLHWLAQLGLDDAHDLGKRCGWDLVLQGTEDSDGLLRQQVDARTEELPQLDQQHILFHGRVSEGGQHLEQGRTCRLSCKSARCMCTHHPATLTVHDPQRTEEEAYKAEKAFQLTESTEPR